jgi:sarcosine oxidase, subunit alpha
VGLIAAYHALQAGIGVAAIVEVAPSIGGYKVHADKIERLGVPILLSTAIVAALGDGRVERAFAARLGPDGKPDQASAAAFDVDMVLVAAGLSPCDELYRQAAAFGIPAAKAGDADEIAEASSALFGGRIAAYELAGKLGLGGRADPSWPGLRDVLKSKPGNRITREQVALDLYWRPVFHCDEEIPCDPCRSVCPALAIEFRGARGDMRDLPFYSGSGCTGCGACVAACPGLAISLARRTRDGSCEVVVPFELEPDFGPGDRLELLDESGRPLGEATLVRSRRDPKRKTRLLTFAADEDVAARAIGLRAARPAESAADREAERPPAAIGGLPPPDEAIVCRCERVTFGELVRFIRENRVADVRQLKSIRAGMGACGSKTCGSLYAAAFRAAGVDPASAAPASLRPLELEVALGEVPGGRSGSAR